MIFDHAKKLIDATQCLRDGGHHVASLMMVYAAIDQMAWLSIEMDKSNSADFKKWAVRFPLKKVKCCADRMIVLFIQL